MHVTFVILNSIICKMCSSRKYPYFHTEGWTMFESLSTPNVQFKGILFMFPVKIGNTHCK